MKFSTNEPLPLLACPPIEPRAPVSFGALKARQIRQRIAVGFYDRRDVARETARRILSDEPCEG